MTKAFYPLPDSGQYVQIDDSANLDAFGRLRISNPVTLFDSKQLHDNQPLYWDDQETSGSGTGSSHSTAYARTQISVSATTAGTRVRQTFQRFNYQPGKSQLILMTGLVSATGDGITARMGMFDDDNGIFYQIEDGVLSYVERSSTSGSAVDTAVAQSSFNGDKLDGSGASGKTLDPTKAQIMWLDVEWLGVGRVRSGFVIDGEFIVCHVSNHANDVTAVYMSTPNLPLRYELSNDGTGAATTMDHICSTVISEGGSESLGYDTYVSTAGTHVDAANENTLYAIVGIRLKSTHLDAVVDVVEASIAEHAGNKLYEWVLLMNPTVAGTFTYASVDTASALEKATGATANTVTNGFPLAGGFGASALKGGFSNSELNNALRLGSAIDGTPDEIVLAVRPVGGTSAIDVEAGIRVRQRS